MSSWKDDAGFYGDSDTFVTLPATARERSLLKRNQCSARGLSFSTAQLTDEQREEEECAGWTCAVSEEDMLLPNDAPESLQSLPVLLKSSCTLVSPANALDVAITEHTIAARVDEMKDLLCDYVFASKLQTHLFFRSMAREVDPLLERFGNVNSELFLDYLPILRCMSVQERVAEAVFLAAQEQDPDGVAGMTHRKRSTRRSKKLGREHYFEKLPPPYTWEASDWTPREVADRLADASLLYER